MTDNEIIARFMGLDVDGVNVTDGNIETTLDKLQYDTSWDELMPVVEKIRSMGYIITIELFDEEVVCQIRKYVTSLLADFYRSNERNSKPSIIAVRDVLVAFIKWYNSQTTKQ